MPLFSSAKKPQPEWAENELWGCFFPIMAFVVGGYEHCVANMYYIPAGMICLTNDTYRQVAMDSYGYTAEQLTNLSLKGLFVNNLLPVTIGNMIGDMVFVALPLYLLHKNKLAKKDK